ncbi:hypothetical protein [Paenarthrobacter sp. YJN-5]|uniref:hypothetical protein n=1 Tax=Paenarthrobacter sp. YJN-5 TaxID=2735316 RepID=UPI001877B4F0|nr:hypothetical protein [Paenarthrobacter sp. YJN-5]QOT19750.1 hypothetical protein HMI59_24125 [Paenarthrobacter sp. YJN-5]
MKALAILALAVLLLTGCASTPTTAASSPPNDYTAPPTGDGTTPTPEPSGPGTYMVGIKGATVLMEVPDSAGPDAETIAVLQSAGVTPGSWIKADLDNRKGQDAAVLNVVGLSTPDGKRVEYKSLPVVTNTVQTSGMTSDVQRRYVTWSNAQKASAQAGERVTVWLMSTTPTPSGFVRVDAASGTAGPFTKAAKQ